MNAQAFVRTYLLMNTRRLIFVGACVAVIFVLVILNISIGLYHISFADSYRVFIDHLNGVVPETMKEIREDHIIFNQRVPRAIAGVCVGATLAVAGAAMQSSLKNPLADPYTTGISSGASLGVWLFVSLGISILPGLAGDTGMIVNAFVFSLIPAGAIIFFSRVFNTSPTSVILIGISIMYVFSACSSLIKLYADPDDLEIVYRWGLGNLGSATWDNLVYMVAASVIATVTMTVMSRRLNILSMNDESVKSLGIDPKRERAVVLLIVSLCTAIVVCFTGTIGFVGLVIPHIIRIFLGSNNTYLVPASAMVGALFLLAADSVAKVAGTYDLPVGVITSLVGGPMFLYILIKQRRKTW